MDQDQRDREQNRTTFSIKLFEPLYQHTLR